MKQKRRPSYHVADDKIFKIGDIITESELIVPMHRGPMNGLVLGVERNAWIFSTVWDSQPQDKVTVLWLDDGSTEILPASVVILFYRTNEESTKEG
ncbi:MAG: hypothetical protein CML45_00650 [Rhodobacteraceae bacterium]|nr:hypothetical protein [Paracoccaceae bacterium]